MKQSFNFGSRQVFRITDENINGFDLAFTVGATKNGDFSSSKLKMTLSQPQFGIKETIVNGNLIDAMAILSYGSKVSALTKMRIETGVLNLSSKRGDELVIELDIPVGDNASVATDTIVFETSQVIGLQTSIPVIDQRYTKANVTEETLNLGDKVKAVFIGYGRFILVNEANIDAYKIDQITLASDKGKFKKSSLQLLTDIEDDFRYSFKQNHGVTRLASNPDNYHQLVIDIEYSGASLAKKYFVLREISTPALMSRFSRKAKMYSKANYSRNLR